MTGLDAVLAAIVITNPDQNCLILFSNILSCFSGTMDQNCKSHHPSIHRGENFGFWLHPEPKSHAPSPSPYIHRTKGLGCNQNLNTGMLSEAMLHPKAQKPYVGIRRIVLIGYWCSDVLTFVTRLLAWGRTSPTVRLLHSEREGRRQLRSKGGEAQKNWEEQEKNSDQDWESWRELLGLTLKVPLPKQ